MKADRRPFLIHPQSLLAFGMSLSLIRARRDEVLGQGGRSHRPPPFAANNHTIMNCEELAARVARLQPNSSPRDIARLCLLLSNAVDDVDKLEDEESLMSAWKATGLRLQAATDQHAAMTEELENLASSDPRKFSPEQIWVLIRAIKVQSQILQL